MTNEVSTAARGKDGTTLQGPRAPSPCCQPRQRRVISRIASQQQIRRRRAASKNVQPIGWDTVKPVYGDYASLPLE
jgi:hypothetical protein